MAHSNDNSETDKDLSPEKIVLRKGEAVADALRQLSGNLHRLAALHNGDLKAK